MAQHRQDRTTDDALEPLKEIGFDGLAMAVTVLLKTAMLPERSEYLEVAPASAAPPE